MLTGGCSDEAALAGLRIEFDQADVAEVGAVGQPQPAVGIEQHAGIDGVAVLDAVGPHHRSAIFPLVVRRLRIQRAADQQSDRGLRLRARRRVVEEEFVADVDDVRRPGVVAAARQDFGSGFAAGQRGHQRALSLPGPAIVRSQDGQAVAGAVGVVAARVQDDRRGIVHAGCRHRAHAREARTPWRRIEVNDAALVLGGGGRGAPDFIIWVAAGNIVFDCLRSAFQIPSARM